MDKLRIRAYNVGFGDAILVSVPDSTVDGKKKLRHILIDVGNILKGDAGQDFLFEPVLSNVLEVLDGMPLDLYVMTHEHLDHVQGLYYAASRLQPQIELAVQHAWLTASSTPDYYEQFTDARKKRLEMEASYLAIEQYTMALQAAAEPIPSAINSLMINNNPRSTKQCIDYLRKLASNQVAYIYRGCDLAGTHPFREASFDIWAPEHNTAEYYGRFQPVAMGVETPKGNDVAPKLNRPEPPLNVDLNDFYQLVEALRQGYVENLLAIDAASNNTSIVFCLNWRGWKLLFSGDAEIKSWKIINKHKVVEPVHFFKVSHHGSNNGMPPSELLDKMFPQNLDKDKELKALVSTCPDIYNNVPNEDAMRMLSERGVEVRSVCKESEPGGYIDFEFPSANE